MSKEEQKAEADVFTCRQVDNQRVLTLNSGQSADQTFIFIKTKLTLKISFILI